MSPRHRMRLVILPAVVTGALLLPASAALASDGKPTPSASDGTPAGLSAEEKKAADERTLAEEKKRGADDTRRTPRGGVDAGEAPATDPGTGPLVGSAVGALVLAGAGTLVLRRRSTR